MLLDEIQALDLDILPKIVKSSKGYSVASFDKSLIEQPLVFFRKHLPLNRNNRYFKQAITTARIAALMIKTDGVIRDSELIALRKLLYSLSFLSESDKYALFIRSVYFLYQKMNQDELIGDFNYFNDKVKIQIIRIAKSLAIADGRIENNERILLRNLYRNSGIPTNTVVRDLKKYAIDSGILIENRDKQELKFQHKYDILDETLDSVLDDLIEDFTGF